MTQKNRLIGIGILAAAFALSATADTWYDDNGVTVEGTGSATVAYRSESSGVWLDITVAQGAEATLTSLTPTTLSIQKLGAGKLVISPARAVSFLVEDPHTSGVSESWKVSLAVQSNRLAL